MNTLSNLKISHILAVLVPAIVGAIIFLVKKYYEHRLKIRENFLRSQLKIQEERDKTFYEVTKEMKLRESENNTTLQEKVKEQILDHWSRICSAISIIESAKEKKDFSKALKLFQEEIRNLRHQVTCVDLFFPYRLREHLILFFARTATICREFFEHQKNADQIHQKDIMSALLLAQSRLRKGLVSYFGGGDFSYLDSPVFCPECGSTMVHNGPCYRCFNCGFSIYQEAIFINYDLATKREIINSILGPNPGNEKQ